MNSEPLPLLTDLLQQVSRSFYKTMRVLPAAVRPQIGLAYLLARTTDTIADTELIPVEQRLDSLRALRDRILGAHEPSLDFGALAVHQGSQAEKTLLLRAEEAVGFLKSFSQADQQLIQEVIATIASGQELDVKRFAGASAENISILGTDPELEDYTYRVAGCVGEFWTKICRRHLFPQAELDEGSLLADAVRFGKGLQLVNILRDLPADLRQGRCYLPEERLKMAGLKPSDLLDLATEPRLRPIYHGYLDLALAHLNAGWAYTNALPRSSIRVRLACAWPILIGVRTLNRLRAGNILDASQRIKISRAEVRSVVFQTVGLYLFRRTWQNLFASTVSQNPVSQISPPDNAVA